MKKLVQAYTYSTTSDRIQGAKVACFALRAGRSSRKAV